ncbi:hypothetical protein [Streptomyces sp. NPDC002530]
MVITNGVLERIPAAGKRPPGVITRMAGAFHRREALSRIPSPITSSGISSLEQVTLSTNDGADFHRLSSITALIRSHVITQ